MSSETNHPQSSQPEDEAAIRSLYTQLMADGTRAVLKGFPLHSLRTVIWSHSTARTSRVGTRSSHSINRCSTNGLRERASWERSRLYAS
jgi:hypothetical protein